MAADDPSDFEWTEGWELRSPVGRDRREAERILAYWEHKLAELGGELTLASLDLSRINTHDWSNRFLISVDQVIERSSLLMYGPRFAKLMQLPEQPRPDLPMMRQLPRRYIDVFMRGCDEAHKTGAPVRLEGEVDRYDNRVEQYRAVFIPIGVKPNSLTCFAFGAFSNRLIEHGAAD
ncbi:MAG TPA: hypothetical protein VHW90_10410 [Stellaceae bacterium]|jgi:hypothetical protein|nr:hypothetical protein [Stellaceae bacterium]